MGTNGTPYVAPPPAQSPGYLPGESGIPTPVPDEGSAARVELPPRDRKMLVLGIVGILFGIGSFLRYPYLLAILAIVMGGVVIAKPENRKGAVLIAACIAILIGIVSIVFDMFYLVILPPVPPEI